MSVKEKAQELFDKFSAVPLLDSYEAKQCALIAVDEMTKYNPNIYHNDMVKEKYYNEVKQEIEKL
jgi:hypothetical protein